MHSKDHWETVYTNKEADAVSWFQPHADLSIDFIKATGMGHDAAITDVGGGASTLVDDLLNAGYSDLTVLDLSTAAMNAAKNVWVSRRTGYTGSKPISPGQSLPGIATISGTTAQCFIF